MKSYSKKHNRPLSDVEWRAGARPYKDFRPVAYELTAWAAVTMPRWKTGEVFYAPDSNNSRHSLGVSKLMEPNPLTSPERPQPRM